MTLEDDPLLAELVKVKAELELAKQKNDASKASVLKHYEIDFEDY